MEITILNDGTYVYDEYTLRRYLEGLGFDYLNLVDDIIDNSGLKEQVRVANNAAKWSELESDTQLQDKNYILGRIQDIARNLEIGKGTKLKNAQDLLAILRDFGL